MKILFLSVGKYPDDGAETIRMHYIAKLFDFLGHSVFIAARGLSTNFEEHVYDGIPYISFRENGSNFLKRVLYYFKYKKYVKKLLNEKTFDAIMVTGISTSTLKFVKRYASKRSLLLLHDSVEWFSPEQFRFKHLHYSYRKKQLWIKKLIDKNFNVITISKYLEGYFLSKGIKCTRIPVIFNISKMSCQKKTDSKKLTIMYAGSPGKKDYLKEIVEALCLLNAEELKKIQLRIIGVDSKKLIKQCGVSKQVIDKLKDNLLILGRMPRNEVLKRLEQADFTVLLRSPTQRYAKAGFPTKVVDSLASATPVICNITSDLGDYVKDGENGIIVDDCSAEAFCKALRRALKLTDEEKTRMFENARKTAEVFFDFRNYSDKIAKLLEEG